MTSRGDESGQRPRRWAVWCGPALALLLALALVPTARLRLDSLIQVATIEGSVDNLGRAPFELYTFAPGDPERVTQLKEQGPFPWFASPELRIRYLRPLSSLLVVVDHALFGRWAPGYRLHAALWYAGLVAALALVTRRALRSSGGGLHPAVALAPALYAVAAPHADAVCFAAARHLVVATTLVAYGLLAHMRWREDGWAPGRWISRALFAAGLLAGEGALAVLGYFAAYELCSPTSLRRRVAGVLPVAALVIAYLATYSLLGFGVDGSDHQGNPLHAPGVYASELPSRFAMLIGKLFLGSSLLAPGWLAFVAVALLAAVLVPPGWRTLSTSERRFARWTLLGSALSALPLLASPPKDRLLLVPFLGGAVLLALLFLQWWTVQRRQLTVARGARGVVFAGLFALHALDAPTRWFDYDRRIERKLAFVEAATRREVFADEESAPWAVVFLTPFSQRGFYQRKLADLPMTEHWWQLTSTPYAQLYTRTDDRTLELRVLNGELLSSPAERGVYSSTRPFAARDAVELAGMTVTILEVNERGPVRVAFRFARSLDDPALRLLAVEGGDLVTFVPPRVGETLRVAARRSATD